MHNIPISVGISFCKEVCVFIKDEIAWRKNKPVCGCQNICSRRDTGLDIAIKIGQDIDR